MAPEKRARSPSASLDSTSPETETRVLSRPTSYEHQVEGQNVTTSMVKFYLCLTFS